jgi:hypothetical protein
MDNRNKDKAQNLGNRGKQGEFENMGDIHGESGPSNLGKGGVKGGQGNLQRDTGKTGLRQDRGNNMGGGSTPGRDISR